LRTQLGSPALTRQGKQAKAATDARDSQFRASAKEDTLHVKGFINEHFHLTPAQKLELDSLSQEDIDEIRKAARTALEKNYKLEMVIKRINPNVAKPRKPINRFVEAVSPAS
jgi:hypothetical protein